MKIEIFVGKAIEAGKAKNGYVPSPAPVMSAETKGLVPSPAPPTQAATPPQPPKK